MLSPLPLSLSLFHLFIIFMAISDVEAVLQFLAKNGFSDAESALREEVLEKRELSSLDFEKFIFSMLPPPPPVRILAAVGGAHCSRSSSLSSDDEFFSLRSSLSDISSSELIDRNGIRSVSPSTVSSEASSDRLSQFGTARNHHENDPFWYEEKDGGNITSPDFEGLDFIACPSEDKFITAFETERLPCHSHFYPLIDCDEKIHIKLDDYHSDKLCVGPAECYSKETDYCVNVVRDITTNCNSAPGHDYSAKEDLVVNLKKGLKGLPDFVFTVKEKDFIPSGTNHEEVNEEPYCEDENGAAADYDELLMYDKHEEEYEVFDLRIIHRKNRTGFEESKDLHLVLNTIIGGRYYVTEYLGSAAFSKVVQAYDLHTGTDVCLKIIKNDKDFFDQSLDEIKLLKLVNKHDPADERHILRLYDYFYFQEHLFIVCELLRANLYEFQKFNEESGGEAYFTLSRLQVITRQCLEALEYLHHLGIIHCDLKPENILIKSYKRCEIKVIDLGSSCFLSDNLCLYVQSRSYRAPEVILGLPYDQKIDMWSLGCILAELCSGEVLFPNDSVVLILARMVGMLGPIDMEMLQSGQETNKYFTEEYDLYHVNEETDQLEYIIPEESSLEHHLRATTDVEFIDFVKNLLQVNPERRLTAEEALTHPWLSHSYEPRNSL